MRRLKGMWGEGQVGQAFQPAEALATSLKYVFLSSPILQKCLTDRPQKGYDQVVT